MDLELANNHCCDRNAIQEESNDVIGSKGRSQAASAFVVIINLVIPATEAADFADCHVEGSPYHGGHDFNRIGVVKMMVTSEPVCTSPPEAINN
jgi:hypothetical protein